MWARFTLLSLKPKWVDFIISCYDLKLELRLHLGKDLRKDKGYIEVVKHKDYRVVSTLYI